MVGLEQYIKQQKILNLLSNFLNMKIKTNFDKETGVFILPVLAIGYQHEDRELAVCLCSLVGHL